MESGAQPGRRLDGLRKRTLEDRKSSGEEFVLPAKQRECDDEKEEYASKASYGDRDVPVSRSSSERYSVAVDLKQFHQAHDVEEHFRRSLESIQMPAPPALKAVDRTNQVATSSANDSHHVMVSKNSTHITTPIITSKPSTAVPLSSSIASSSQPSTTIPASTSTIPTPQNLQYYVNTATGTVFAAGVPSTRVPTGMAGLQVPSFMLGLPSGLQQQSVSVAQSVGQPSISTVKMSPPKPVTATADSQQQLLAVAAAAGMAQPGGILLPQLTSSTTNPGFISIIDSNGMHQLLATSTPATTVAQATPAAVNGGSGGGGGGNSPVILLGPSNVPVVPPNIFYLSPSELPSVQTASAVNTAAAAANLVNFNNQSIRTSTSSPGYIVLPPSAVQAPMNISGLTGLTPDQLLTLATVQQQQLQQLQQQQVKASTSPPLTSLASRAQEPTTAVQNIMAGGGGSVEDHFARALGDQWIKVKQSTAPQQNKITA